MLDLGFIHHLLPHLIIQVGGRLPKVFLFEQMEFSSRSSHGSSTRCDYSSSSSNDDLKCLKTWIEKLPCFLNVHLLLPTLVTCSTQIKWRRGLVN